MRPETAKLLVKGAFVSCDCGQHYVDFLDPRWNDRNLGFYSCNTCRRPLVVRGGDDTFYAVGEKL